MSEPISLPGDILLTENMVNVIATMQSRQRDSTGIPSPIISIAFTTALTEGDKGRWDLIVVSKAFTPPQTLFRAGDFDLALSSDVQVRLRGKVVDFVNGDIEVYERGSGSSLTG